MSDTIQDPIWTVKSDEITAGIAILFMLTMIPVFPLVITAWYVGDEIIGMNIAKWGLSIFAFILGYIIITYLKNRKNILYAIGFVLIEYMSLDIYLTYKNPDSELVIYTIVKNIFTWAISNT